MYLSYYNLTEKPFQINTDPKFLWQGEKHKEALAMLKYGILDSRGFLFLTGEIGTGKTTLINDLTNQLGDKIIAAIVPDPDLEKIDFFNFVASAFNINRQFKSKGEFLIYFSRFLRKAYLDNKKVLLIIDEAQKLSNELLEEIRLLSNIEKRDAKLINIFFVGQNEFKDILLKPKNRALRQRITINYQLDPITENETKQYIQHRLKVAGSQKNIFTSKAIHEIFSFSRGYPRLINIICDHSLLTGYVKEKKTINSNIVNECAKELTILPQAIEEKEEEYIETAKTKQESRQEKSGKSRKKHICLLCVLLLIAGYIYYSYDTKDWPVKQIFQNPNRSVQIQRQTLQRPKKSVQIQKQTLQRPEKSVQIQKETLQSDTEEKTSIKIADQKEYPQFPILLDQGLIISFSYDSNELSTNAFEKLDPLAAAMISNADIGIIVKGYTDKSGGYLYNKKLSGFRANIVKGYLVGKGVSPSKIKTIGMGPAEVQIKIPGIGEKKISDRRVEIELDMSNSK